MASKIYTDRQDEQTIDQVINKGLRAPTGFPKWKVLRLALALSMRLPTLPDDSLDRREGSGGSEYSLEQVTGERKSEEEDYTPVFRALLSLHHDQDLFADSDAFVQILQRHIRRGLRELRTTWMESHDFHDVLLHALFHDLGANQNNPPQESLSDKLQRALSEIGISTEIVQSKPGPRLTRFLVRLRDVNDHGQLQRGLEKLSFALGLGDSGVFLATTKEPKVAALDVPRTPDLWHTVSPKSMADWLANVPANWRLPIFLGQNVEGEGLGFDLAAAPHVLIGGTTGSGKSVCIHALLLSLLSRFDHQHLQLLLIDPKRVELSLYAELPHLREDGVVTEVEDALLALDNLVVEMEHREQTLAAHGLRDIDDPRAERLAWPRIVVVVEELADLIMQASEIEEPLVRLAQKARATGIHLVLATQRPDAQTFSGLLRSNIPTRIALTVQKSSESKIILDEVGAEKLLGRGDMLIKIPGRTTERLHGVLITPSDITQGITSAKRR